MAKSSRKLKPFALVFNTKGQNRKDGLFYIQPDSADTIENLHMDTMGQWTSYNRGASNFTSQLESGARIDSLGYLITPAGDERMLCAVNGKINRIHPETGAVVATLSTANTAGKSVAFKTFKGTVFIGEETMAPEKWDGSSGTTSAMSSLPKTVGSDTYTKPYIFEVYQNRLVAGPFNGFPSHLSVSDDNDPDTITIGSTDTNGLIAQVKPGDGYGITALKTFYIPALDDEILLIFKEKGLYRLSGNTPNTFEIKQINPQVGCLNKNCVVQVGPDVFFMDRENIQSLTTANQSGTIEPKIVGNDKIRDVYRKLNLTQKHKAWAAHIPSKNEVWFGIPTGSSSEVDTILVYRYPASQEEALTGPAWSIRKRSPITCVLQPDEHSAGDFYTGNTTGYIQKWFTASTLAGVGIACKYTIPFYNFGSAFQNKRITDARAWFYVRQDTTFTIRTRWRRTDEYKHYKTTGKLLEAPEAPEYGSAIYGQSVYAASGGKLMCLPFTVYGNGTQLQVEVEWTTGTSGPEFLGYSGVAEYGSQSRDYI